MTCEHGHKKIFLIWNLFKSHQVSIDHQTCRGAPWPCWPQCHWALIGRGWSRDLNTGLWLVQRSQQSPLIGWRDSWLLETGLVMGSPNYLSGKISCIRVSLDIPLLSLPGEGRWGRPSTWPSWWTRVCQGETRCEAGNIRGSLMLKPAHPIL